MMPVIIIPAYKPDHHLLQLVAILVQFASHIIIVNDGSGEEYDKIFNALNQQPQVLLLKHAVNLGKGQALKTGFNHFLTHFPTSITGVITADADGQHLASDIYKIYQAFSEQPTSLWLGARRFNWQTPWRSRLGNQLTTKLFRMLIGHSLKDTQTGLRAIPRSFLPRLLATSSRGYDFELDMLILAFSAKISVQEIPIQTVYRDANQHSHFNPLVDSLKIYFIFLRWLFFPKKINMPREISRH